MTKPADVVGEYSTFMNEIFRRLDAVAESLNEMISEPEHPDNWQNCDFCWTQIRKVCEYLALAIVLAHYRETGAVDLTKWKPKDLLAEVEKLSDHPRPVQISPLFSNGESNEKQITPVAKPVDAKIISEIYGRSSDLLHVGKLERLLNSEMPAYDLSQLQGWLSGFNFLLRNHVLLLPRIETVLVCVSGEDGNQPPNFFMLGGAGEAVFETGSLPAFEFPLS